MALSTWRRSPQRRDDMVMFWAANYHGASQPCMEWSTCGATGPPSNRGMSSARVIKRARKLKKVAFAPRHASWCLKLCHSGLVVWQEKKLRWRTLFPPCLPHQPTKRLANLTPRLGCRHQARGVGRRGLFQLDSFAYRLCIISPGVTQRMGDRGNVIFSSPATPFDSYGQQRSTEGTWADGSGGGSHRRRASMVAAQGKGLFDRGSGAAGCACTALTDSFDVSACAGATFN